MKMHFKTTLAMLATTMVCLGLYATYSLARTDAAMLEAELARLTAVADARVSELRTLTANFAEYSNLVASRTRLRQLLADYPADPSEERRAKISRILTDAAASSSMIDAISVIGLDSTILASTDPALVGRATSDAPITFGAPPNEPSRSKLAPIIVDGVPHFANFTPMSLEGELIGMVQVEFAGAALHTLAEAISNAGFGRTGEVLLGAVGPGGRIVSLTATRDRDPQAASNVELGDIGDRRLPMARALAGENAAIVEGATDHRGESVIAVVRHVPELGVGLVSKIDSRELRERSRAAHDALASFGGALVVLSLLAGRVIGGRLTEANSQLEAELEARTRAEERFHLMFEHSPSPMLMLDAEQRIVLANHGIEDMLGYAPGELIGLDFEALVPDFLRERHRRLQAEFDAREAAWPIGTDEGLMILHKQGHAVPISAGVTPIRTQASPGVLVALVDLTSSKESERILEERALELERSNRELDAFAYVASHDLRSPLRSMEQLASFIEEDAGDVMPKASLEDLQLLRSRVARMDRLLTDLLEYSRIGRQESRPEKIETGELVREIATLYVPADRFDIEIADDMPIVEAPRPVLDLVLRNLMMNAVKHHDQPRGVIRVGWRRDADFVHLEVSDDGPGIPTELRERVFQIFQTLKPKDESEGSGMGLSFVQKAMATRGGNVTIADTTGRGLTVVTSWPTVSA